MGTRPQVSIRLATDGKAQVARDFVDIGDSGDASAKRISNAYERAANDADAALARVQKAAERMASIAPNSAGATNVTNPITGGGYDQAANSARNSAAAMQQQFAAADQAAQRLLASVDPLFAAQMRYDEALAQANTLLAQGSLSAEQFARVQTGLKAQLDGATVSMGGFRNASGTARIAQMELMGAARGMTDAIAIGMPIQRAVTMEMGRLTEAAAFMGGGLGAVGEFLSGPWGIALMVGTVALVPLIGKLLDTSNATDDAVDKLKKQAEQQKVTGDANAIFGDSLEGVTEALRKNQEALDKLADSDRTAAERALDVANKEAAKADAIRRTTVAILQQQQANLTNAQAVQFGAGGGASAYGAQSFYQQQVDAAAAAVKRAQQDVIDAGKQQIQAIALITAEAAAKDPVDKIKQHYKDLIDAATKRATQEALAAKSAGDQVKAQQLVTTELKKQVSALQEQGAAAVKAYEDAHRAPRKLGKDAGGEAIDAAQMGAFFDIASKYRGMSETGDKAVLESFFRAANENLDPEKVAWCAAFVNAVLAAGGVHGSGSLAAGSFLTYGKDDTHSPQRGDVVVVRSNGSASGMHVGFLDSIDSKGNVSLLGGNTGNKVGEETVSASNVLAVRRPPSPGEEAAAQQKKLEDLSKADFGSLISSLPNAGEQATTAEQIAAQQRLNDLIDGQMTKEEKVAFDQGDQVNFVRQYNDGLSLTLENIDKILPGLEGWKKQFEQLTASMEEMKQFGDQEADSIFNIDNWKKWGDLGMQVLHDLEQELVKLTLLNPLKNWMNGENNPTISSLFQALGNVFGGGGGGQTLNIDLPLGFATGTESAPGGLSWVGEFGKELVQLPRGSKVYPAAQSQRMAANDRGIGSITIPINIDATGADSAELARVNAKLDELKQSLPATIVMTYHDAVQRGAIR